ncbi:hypothetical protein ERJ75_001238600 [Trypanosoma vivax]|nr:hypothetical protein ERJ75_001238600 [Trypanosoma vivax]
MLFLTKSKSFASEGNTLANTSRTIAGAEWNVFLRAARAVVEERGQSFSFFDHRPREDVGVRMLTVFFFFELPKSGDITRAFEAAKECFQNEWRALAEGRSALFQQCEAAPSQIDEERQRMQATFAAADGENNVPNQWICQPQRQINRRSSAPKASGTPTECSRLRIGF